MITRKKITIPIYRAGFVIHVADDIMEFKDYYGVKGSYEMTPATTAFYTCFPDVYLFNVFIKANTPLPIIAHECHHIKNSLWDCIGHNPTLLEDEPDAYLLQYLISEVIKVQNKHNKRNDNQRKNKT